jgi:hypothetical protein
MDGLHRIDGLGRQAVPQRPPSISRGGQRNRRHDFSVKATLCGSGRRISRLGLQRFESGAASDGGAAGTSS